MTRQAESAQPGRPPVARSRRPPRLPIVLLLFTLLAIAILAGLVRAGLVLPDGVAVVLGPAVLNHGGLMLSALFGTAISLERAVALRQRWALLAPAAALAGGLCLAAGSQRVGAGLLCLAALVLVAATRRVVQRQAAAHTRLLLLAVLGWLAGNLLFLAAVLDTTWIALALPGSAPATLALWFSFPVLTVAAERLEMTRVMRRPRVVESALVAISMLVLAAALLAAWQARAGGSLFGVALMLLAAWLGLFDVARRTVRGEGLAAYMAWCLLCGYAWLELGGLAWLGTAWGCPGRDLMLHAIGLGFLFSMIMGHAPVILPAVSGWRIAFRTRFYLPLLALQLSLLLRLFGALWAPGLRLWGAGLNALALLAFLAVLAASVRSSPAAQRAVRAA